MSCVCVCARLSLGHLIHVQTLPDLTQMLTLPEVVAQVTVACKYCQLCCLYMQCSPVLFKLQHTGN